MNEELIINFEKSVLSVADSLLFQFMELTRHSATTIFGYFMGLVDQIVKSPSNYWTFKYDSATSRVDGQPSFRRELGTKPGIDKTMLYISFCI